MTRLLILVVSIAVADSANPATIGPALYLATVERPLRRMSEFAAAFLLVNLVAGFVIVAGPGELLLAAIPKPDGTAKDIIELAVGVLLIALGVALIAGRERAGRLAASEPALGSRGAWSLGAAIAAAELPTALPYFATLAAIVGSGLSLPRELLLVAVFNLIFILPVLIMIALLAFTGERAAPHLRRAGDWLRRRAPLTFATLALGAGAVLTTLGITGLAGS